MADKSYDHCENDSRTPETIQKQSDLVSKLCDRNQQAFKEFLTKKMTEQNEQLSKQKSQKLEKTKIKLERMDLDEGRYVEYRDNKSEQLNFQMPNKTIILISGVPGGIRYFKRIEKSIEPNFCRMINLYIPGFDRKDEQRGSYKGSLDDLTKLIHDFLANLNLPKAIFLLHSFGGLIVKTFAYAYPQKVEAMIQIASVPITKWKGFKIYENIELSFFDIDTKAPLSELFSDSYRENLSTVHKKIQEDLNKLPTEQKKQLDLLLKMSFYDVISLMKLRVSVPGGLLEIIQRMKKVSKLIPRMMVFSSNDELIEPALFEQEIYEFVAGENALKRRILKQNNQEPKLDLNNFCGNYIFNFKDATHNVQHDKGKELGFLVQHFVSQLDDTEIIYKYPKL